MQKPGLRLFHISEEGGIHLFQPRPSPSFFDKIKRDVVFAISGQLVHNYLFPRECPRVSFYKNPETTAADILAYFGNSQADYIVVVEERWIPLIRKSTVYRYEFPVSDFELLDETAGYYISSQPVVPLGISRIENPMKEISNRSDVELRILPEITSLARKISTSSLSFSLIRMRNSYPH